MERKSKTIFQLDSPFTRTQFPTISPEHQETILELLCSFLSPIGQHRLIHVPASKGKRSKKRKRQDAKLKGEPLETVLPASPEISPFVVVGLSSITRNLEALSRQAKPSDGSQAPSSEDNHSEGDKEQSASKACASHFSAIFVLSQSLPAVLQEHLPQLVATACLAHPTLPATRLIQLPKGSDARICSALGLQRASVVGILHGAPRAQALEEFVRRSVTEVQIAWLDEIKKGQYLPVNIKAIDTFGWAADKTAPKS